MPIEIANPNPLWPQEFALIAAQLWDALGRSAERIDHIGSTSVPGLAAKDVIDIQLTLAPNLDTDSLDAVLARLSEAGWQARQANADHPVPGENPDPREWVKRLACEPPGQRRVNCHLRIAGRANQRYALLFRDYLRAHPDTAAAYGEYKKRAAELPFTSVGEYADLKDPVCDLIYLPAKDWAARTGWAPLPLRLAARIIVADPAGRILLFRHQRSDEHRSAWVTPGGAVTAGETVAAGAIRELQEETGIKLSEVDAGAPVTLAVGQWHGRAGLFDTTNWFFFARVTGGDIDTSGHEPHEQIALRQYRWMTLDEIQAEIDAGSLVLPQGLTALLPDLLAGTRPERPVQFPWVP